MILEHFPFSRSVRCTSDSVCSRTFCTLCAPHLVRLRYVKSENALALTKKTLSLGRFLLLALLLLVSACSGKPYAIPHEAEQSPIRQNTVYIDSHGWHTGFVVPAEKMNEVLPSLKDRFPNNSPYYEFGWGDKGFYQSHEITIGLTLRAMFWSSGSVVHVVAVPFSPTAYFAESTVIAVKLSDNEFNNLRKFIQSSFSYDARGNPIKLQQGIYGDSQFYEGAGDYTIFNTCNKWTARGLKSAGLNIATPFKLTASSVMDYLKENNP